MPASPYLPAAFRGTKTEGGRRQEEAQWDSSQLSKAGFSRVLPDTGQAAITLNLENSVLSGF